MREQTSVLVIKSDVSIRLAIKYHVQPNLYAVTAIRHGAKTLGPWKFVLEGRNLE